MEVRPRSSWAGRRSDSWPPRARDRRPIIQGGATGSGAETAQTPGCPSETFERLHDALKLEVRRWSSDPSIWGIIPSAHRRNHADRIVRGAHAEGRQHGIEKREGDDGAGTFQKRSAR